MIKVVASVRRGEEVLGYGNATVEGRPSLSSLGWVTSRALRDAAEKNNFRVRRGDVVTYVVERVIM